MYGQMSHVLDPVQEDAVKHGLCRTTYLDFIYGHWHSASWTYRSTRLWCFLMARPPQVLLNGLKSCKLVLNTALPQGCVLSPILFSAWGTSLFKYADDMALVANVDSMEAPIQNQPAVKSPVNHLLTCSPVQWEVIGTEYPKDKGVVLQRQSSNYISAF